MKRQTREERKALRQAIESENHKEEAISLKSDYGFRDLTPYNAIRDMRGEGIVYYSPKG